MCIPRYSYPPFGALDSRFFPERFHELGIGLIYAAIHAEVFREGRMGEAVTITLVIDQGLVGATRGLRSGSARGYSPSE